MGFSIWKVVRVRRGLTSISLSKEIGYIPYPLSAEVMHQASGRVVSRWVAPAFLCGDDIISASGQ